MDFDTIVIGGGLVGAATAYGLTQQGSNTALLDEGDIAFRASFGNFGVVWVQSKGDGKVVEFEPGNRQLVGDEVAIFIIIHLTHYY